MKIILLICIAVCAIVLQSCHKPGEIQIQNNIDQVKIVDVKWGNFYLATELLPGEASQKHKIRRYDEKLPSSHKISFKMTTNDKSIYLETQEKYLLDEGDDLLIVLSNETKVVNPN